LVFNLCRSDANLFKQIPEAILKIVPVTI
jgi:hypothetical protein